MVDQETVAVYDAKVAEYADAVSSAEPDQDLRAFMDALPTVAKVLDLGCGTGNSSAMMREAGFNPDPVDASAGMVAHAREIYGLDARQMTFDELDAEAAYDGVWANFSLLHAPRADLPRHVGAIATALKPGGHFHIGMKTGEDEKRDGIGRKYTYVTVPELRDLFARAGFEVIRERLGADKGLDGVVADWAVMLGRKTADA